MTITSLNQLVVGGFPLSKTRSGLWDNLKWLIDELQNLGIRCKVWVDGSFLTEKIDPQDVDVVIDVHVQTHDNITAPQSDFLNKIASQAFYSSNNLDSYVIIDAPIGHSLFPVSQIGHDQWKRDFGHAYVSRQPKGIAVVEVKP